MSSLERRVRLLVVDDSAQICTLVVRALASSEFDVVGTASTASEALALAKTLIPDVVLLDRELPDSSGFETLRRLLRDLPNVRVVIFSGDFDPSLISQAIELGACSYVPKGSSTAGLLCALRVAVSEARVARV